MLDESADLDVLTRGCEIIREIFSAQPLARHVKGELSPGPEVGSKEEWEAWLRSDSVTIFHPCGTCKMGLDPMSVVDAELKVRGLEGLRVVDASIMPHLVSGNINGPTIMIGERGSDLILGDSSPR